MDPYLAAAWLDLSLRDLQLSTQKTYFSHVRRFLQFVGRNQARFTADDVRGYLLDLRGRGRSTTTINIARVALVFWFTHTLGRPGALRDVPRGMIRRYDRLPVVPTREEIARLLDATDDLFFRTLLQTAYATGMRSRELRNLRARHICAEEGVIRLPAEYAKGRRARLVLCGRKLVQLLRAHWRRCQLPGPLLFPSRIWRGTFAAQPRPKRPWTTRPVQGDAVNKAIRNAQVAARIDKRLTLHSFRHAFATHLLE